MLGLLPAPRERKSYHAIVSFAFIESLTCSIDFCRLTFDATAETIVARSGRQNHFIQLFY
jgi:hypothetical protein